MSVYNQVLCVSILSARGMQCHSYGLKRLFTGYLRFFSQNSNKKSVANTDDCILSKVIHNSVLSRQKPSERTIRRLKYFRMKESLSERARPIFLKYLSDDKEEYDNSQGNLNQEPNHNVVNYPYQSITKVGTTNYEFEDVKTTFEKANQSYSDLDTSVESELKSLKKPDKNWMKYYDTYYENKMEDDNDDQDTFYVNETDINYGTADPNVPVSDIPCGGCGAHLHCQDPAIPGYLPREVFTETKETLRSLICQRCYFLKEYNTALGINVTPEDYLKVLSQIRSKTALIVLMIDLLDFPCSIWPGIIDFFGRKRPIFVVANKIDLLPQDSYEFKVNIKKSVVKSLEECGFIGNNILHVELISSKTGYGIEPLISNLFKLWSNKGDVYLVGCTNVGKSTLFNRLIVSDYCKVKAIDKVQRATTSLWPGTTLNTLRFPIKRGSRVDMFKRSKRLMEQREKTYLDEVEHMETLKGSKYLKQQPLSGFVGRTFGPRPTSPLLTSKDPFQVRATAITVPNMIGLEPEDKDYVSGRWFYDTPGVVNPQLILDLLTTSELVLTLAKSMVIPRTYCIKQGYTLFIGGLSRLDYVRGSPAVRTFGPRPTSPLLTSKDPFQVRATAITVPNMIGLEPEDKDYVSGRWFYDTPGVVNPQQILDLLTTSELVLTLAKSMVIPRTYCIKQGYTLFIGGLSRLDYVRGSPAVRLTVFASEHLPVTITKTEDADEVYERLLGTEYFVVPIGNEERLSQWPELECREFDIVGDVKHESAADVVLSSSGWIAVNTMKGPDTVCHVRAWSPRGRGLHLRVPALLPRAVKLRGDRIANTPLYKRAVVKTRTPDCE